MDPLAAHASSFTPYNYAFNNPVMFNDPMGDYPQEVKDDMEAHERYLRETGGGARHLGSFNPFAGYQGPGSQYHWSDGYRSAEGNLAIMSQATWLSFYGVTDGSGQIDTERRDQFASALSVAPGQQHIEQVAKRYKLNVESIGNGVMYVATTLEAPLYLNGLEAENQIKPGTYTYHAIYLGAQQNLMSHIDILHASPRLDVFRETTFLTSPTAVIIEANTVYIEYDKSGKIKEKSGFRTVQLVTIFENKGVFWEKEYHKLRISTAMEEFISAVENFHCSGCRFDSEKVLDRYLDYFFGPTQKDRKDKLKSGTRHQ